MERRDNHTEGFESFLKEKADQHKLYPSEKVWNAIHDNLHSRVRLPYLAVTVIFLGLGFGGKIFDARQGNLSSKVILNTLHAVSSGNTSPADKTLASVAYDQPPLRIVHSVNRLNRIPVPSGKQETGMTAVVPANVPVMQVIQRDIHDKNPDNSSVLLPPAEKIIVAGNYFVNQDGRDQIQAPIGMRNMAGLNTTDPVHAKSMELATETGVRYNVGIPVLKPHVSKLGLQFYLSPTMSYRKLSGTAVKANNFNNYPTTFTANTGYPRDVNSAVYHKALPGIELGSALVYKVSNALRLKAGLQVNLNQYDIQAYGYSQEVAPLSAGGIGHTQINAISVYRNFNGYYQTWLRNQHVMLSMPLGMELALFGNNRIQFNVAGTFQPTYNFNNHSYMISTNLKNYAQDPSLFRTFNMNTAVEAFFSINTGSMRWTLGPQFRYQLLSSYKSSYPISEHLVDYGFKVGVTKTLK